MREKTMITTFEHKARRRETWEEGETCGSDGEEKIK